jgi:hypothetical protein
MVKYYKRWMIFREFLRSCLHGVCVSGVECSVIVECESAADADVSAVWNSIMSSWCMCEWSGVFGDCGV